MNAKALLMVALLIGVLGLVIVSEDADAEELDSFVQVQSYKTENGIRLILNEKGSAAYPNVEVLVYAEGLVTMFVDGVDNGFVSAGLNHFVFSFEEGSTHTISIQVGEELYDYAFRIRASIPIEDIDPDDIVEYLTITKAELDSQRILSAFFAFIATFAGIILAYRYARRRAAREVRSI